MDTIIRHWTLLRGVPRQPYKKDAKTLTEHLRDEGFEVTKRTVERDLIKLSGVFPLCNDESPTGYGWSWMRDADPFDVPGMDPESALTFEILERFARHLLPRSVLRRLDPHFRQADSVLEQLSPQAGPRAWPERVRILPRTIDLKSPKVAPDVVEVVYRGLLEGTQIDADYRPRVAGGDTVRSYRINPLGLVFRDQVAYLVATLWDYDDIRQLALHRFTRAALLDEPRNEVEGFDLDRYIEAGHFQIREGSQPLSLRVRFTTEAAYHLHETPLADDQRLEELQDGQTELTATVNDTAQLRWWLHGFGSSVEVMEPHSLRAEFEREARRQAERYGVLGQNSEMA